MSENPNTEVLYNADCPVCAFEINHYRKHADKHTLPIRFDDLNGAELARWGIAPQQAARRLYVRQGDDLVSGIPAFQRLWAQMPGYRWLAKLTALPVVHPVSVWVYDRVLAPVLYRWHLSRQARRATKRPHG